MNEYLMTNSEDNESSKRYSYSDGDSKNCEECYIVLCMIKISNL